MFSNRHLIPLSSLPLIYTLTLLLSLSSSTIHASPTGTPHFRDYFYIGGHYVADPDSSSLHADGQIYVERLTPASGVTKQYPLLMIHGSGMTGTNFLNTPDGRMGWADWFLGQGYTVYLMDQPSRGRSPWLQNIDGPQTVFSTELVESMFTATARFDLWPNATLHTQWPGNGSVGDAVFDEFYASMVPLLSTDVESATKNQKALVDLVDKIGPIHLLTHSQSGLFGWSLADARPRHIKSLTAIEPGGPPFTGDILTPNETTRLYGLTDIPLHYVPPLPHNSSSALNKDKIIVNDPASDGYICFAQSPPLRVLPHLEDVPVRVVTSEASWHGVSDGCVVRYMREVGMRRVEWVRLQDVGIRGNGHMFFMERNSDEIVREVVGPWIQRLDRDRKG